MINYVKTKKVQVFERPPFHFQNEHDENFRRSLLSSHEWIEQQNNIHRNRAELFHLKRVQRAILR